MRILMFGWEFPPVISGGLGRVCYALTKHLTALGVHILFVLPKASGSHPAFPHFQIKGANEFELSSITKNILNKLSKETLKYLEVDILLNPYMNEQSYKQELGETIKHLNFIKELKNRFQLGHLHFSGEYGMNLFQEVSRYAIVGALLSREESFDLIHAHDWITFPAALEAKRMSGKPLICHIHATEFDRTGDHPNQQIYDIERHGLHAADRVITVSYRTREMLIHRYGVDPNKIVVVHNAVDKEKLVERENIKRTLKEKIVLFLGRVTIQKGPDYFVEAARLVLKKIKNVRFVMAGTGDMLHRLVERVAHYRMQKHFHFTGFLHGKEVEELFALSDLYVMPSVSEPFGITPFEAMLYHVPIIISKQSGIAEVLHNAITVDFWDVEKLAEHIIKILSDEVYTKNLIEAGAHELEGVSWHVASQKVLSLYKGLVS